VKYDIVPVSKPRQTQRDKWKKRDCVLRYRAFKDEVRLHRVQVPESQAHIIFVLPMPKSWSKKKRAEMAGKPHQAKPDKDNLEKALLDAVFEEDSQIWDNRVSKFWGDEGAIIIRPLPDEAKL